MQPENNNRSDYLDAYKGFMGGYADNSYVVVPPEELVLARYRAQWFRPNAISKHRKLFSARLTYVGP